MVLGKGLSAGCRALSQAFIIYLLSLLLGDTINCHPLALAGVLPTVVLGAALFSISSLIIACLGKTRERFMGIGSCGKTPRSRPCPSEDPCLLRSGTPRAIRFSAVRASRTATG